jgi:hypothetical protein
MSLSYGIIPSMNTKKLCPDCGRQFSEHLITFPVFLDDKNETDVYMICPLCAFEKRNNRPKEKQTPFSERSKGLYKEALLEAEANSELDIKLPISNEELKFEKLTRLTPEEYDLVIKNHPELEEEEKN